MKLTKILTINSKHIYSLRTKFFFQMKSTCNNTKKNTRKCIKIEILINIASKFCSRRVWWCTYYFVPQMNTCPITSDPSFSFVR